MIGRSRYVIYLDIFNHRVTTVRELLGTRPSPSLIFASSWLTCSSFPCSSLHWDSSCTCCSWRVGTHDKTMCDAKRWEKLAQNISKYMHTYARGKFQDVEPWSFKSHNAISIYIHIYVYNLPSLFKLICLACSQHLVGCFSNASIQQTMKFRFCPAKAGISAHFPRSL